MKIENSMTMKTQAVAAAFAETKTQATSSGSSNKTRGVKDPAPVQEGNPSPDESRRVSADDVRAALKEMNEKLSQMNHSLKFSVDDATEDIVVKIVDSSNGEVIQQIPPEEVLRFRERMKEMMSSGLLVEETV